VQIRLVSLAALPALLICTVGRFYTSDEENPRPFTSWDLGHICGHDGTHLQRALTARTGPAGAAGPIASRSRRVRCALRGKNLSLGQSQQSDREHLGDRRWRRSAVGPRRGVSAPCDCSMSALCICILFWIAAF